MMRSQPKPPAHIDLLEVFRTGLLYDLFEKEEIISWAQDAVATGAVADDVVIKTAGAKTKAELLNVIGSSPEVAANMTNTRALLGIIYHLFVGKMVAGEQALTVIGHLNERDLLTSFESSALYELSEDFWILNFEPEDSGKNDDGIINTLKIYEDFRIDNYREWARVDQEAELVIAPLEAEVQRKRAAWHQQQEANLKIQQRPVEMIEKRSSVSSFKSFLVVLIPILILCCIMVVCEPQLTRDQLYRPIIIFSIVILIRGANVFFNRSRYF